MNLGRLQEWVDAGRLDTGRVLTMRDLRDNGVVHKMIPHGVKLLAKARCALAPGVLLDGASPWRLASFLGRHGSACAATKRVAPW